MKLATLSSEIKSKFKFYNIENKDKNIECKSEYIENKNENIEN